MNEAVIKKTEAPTTLVRSDDIDWKPLAEPGITGIYIKSLLFDEETNRSPTILLKFEAGARYPAHNHPGGEEIFVIEGDLRLGTNHLYAGDYLYTAPNGIHAARSINGCVVLLRVPQAVEIIKNQNS